MARIRMRRLVLILCCAALVVPALYSQQGSSAPAALSDDGLRQMLTAMGYEPKPLSKGYLLAIKRDTWTLNVQVVLSDNKQKIGMNANVGLVENPDAVTATQWRSLLIANGDIDPSFFYYDATTKKLFLHRVLDNTGLTAAMLRSQIDSFCENIKNTENLWKFTK